MYGQPAQDLFSVEISKKEKEKYHVLSKELKEWNFKKDKIL
jgi:hypothetical protein